MAGVALSGTRTADNGFPKQLIDPLGLGHLLMVPPAATDRLGRPLRFAERGIRDDGPPRGAPDAGNRREAGVDACRSDRQD